MLQLVKELFFLAPQPTTEVYNLICIFLLNAFLSIMKKKSLKGTLLSMAVFPKLHSDTIIHYAFVIFLSHMRVYFCNSFP